MQKSGMERLVTSDASVFVHQSEHRQQFSLDMKYQGTNKYKITHNIPLLPTAILDICIRIRLLLVART